MAWPRSVLRPTPKKGDPRMVAAVGLLTIQRAPVMGVTAHWLELPPLPTHPALILANVPNGSPVVPVAAAGHVAPVPSQYWPTVSNGKPALLRIGRQASSAPPVKLVGSHSDPGCAFCSIV